MPTNISDKAAFCRSVNVWVDQLDNFIPEDAKNMDLMQDKCEQYWAENDRTNKW